jgi:8-oxo-dGTP diphosphatase
VSAEERPRIVLVNRCIIVDGGSRILLIQRAPESGHYAGLWEVPGGKLDEGQDLSHALEREVLEETGLLVESVSRLVFADSFVLGAGKYAGLPYVVLFSIGRSLGGELRLDHESSSSAWVSYSEALDYNLTPEVRKALIVLKDQLV